MEPQQPLSSRSSFSDPQIAVQGPVPLFDTHLKRLSDSYLTFFQERYAFTVLLGWCCCLMLHNAGNELKRISMFSCQFPLEMSTYIMFSIESLRRLHRKIKTADAYLDDRGEQPTTRSVWSEIVENVERGASLLCSIGLLG